ncbi:MAG: FKBP-type peptidyl-prolyl cis-trans isomerase [Saprospiraceae bacterium]|jgi:FKBP-type peptidyl-prolyl cis-trans isomerase
MKQLFLFLTIIFFSFNLSAQDNLQDYLSEFKIKTQSTSEGIHYTFEKKGRGEMAKLGKFVKVNYRATLLDGTEFDSSPADEPFVFEVGYKQVIRGLDRGIQLLPEGTKGTLYIPSILAFGKTGKGENIPPNADVIFDVEVLEVMDYDAYDRYMRELEEKEKADYARQERLQFLIDKKAIADYAASHKLKVKTLPSGVSYVVKKRGKGANAGSNSLVTMDYEGRLTDDTFFDGEGVRSFKFWMEKEMVIKGLEEAMPFFNQGAEGIILVPSKLAYGQRAIQENEINVPSNSVLIFEMVVKEIKNR